MTRFPLLLRYATEIINPDRKNLFSKLDSDRMKADADDSFQAALMIWLRAKRSPCLASSMFPAPVVSAKPILPRSTMRRPKARLRRCPATWCGCHVHAVFFGRASTG